MSFFSALYMLQYVLIVKIFHVTCIFIQKKKKMTRTSLWVKIPKLCHKMPQNAPLSIFSLGKGRESLCLKSYEKLLLQVRFLTFSPACTKLDKASMTHLKNCPKCIFFHLSSNRREQNLAHTFQFKTPARKLTRKMKFEHFCM